MKGKEPTRSRAGLGLPAWAVPAIVVLLTAAAYWPSLWNDFAYDDDANILRNMDYRGLGWTNLRWMWTTFHLGHYQPLSWMTLGLDYELWGMNPRGYHLTNLLLHLGSTVLVYFLSLELLRRAGVVARERGKIGAAAAAMIFAVHPLRVESVAWVTERRDVLSSFFFIATVLLYLRAPLEGPQRTRKLIVVVAVFALSLLSRAMGVTLPIILLILDWYPLKRLGGGPGRWFGREVRSIWREKLPFVILAAATAAIAPLAQEAAQARIAWEVHGLGGRLTQSCYGLAFYLYKTILPWGLVPLYPARFPLDIASPRFVGPILFVVAAGIAITLVARRWPWLSAAALCYTILLLPVLGLVQSGSQLVADRYTYLPSIGWAILLGALLERLVRGRHAAIRNCANVATALVVAILCILTYRQCGFWRNQEMLWRHAIAAGPRSAMAHYNLACALGRVEQESEAVVQYGKSLEINPLYAPAHYNLANALSSQGKFSDALKRYQDAIRCDPRFAKAYYELGKTYAKMKQPKEAEEALRKSLQLQPTLAAAHEQLGLLLAGQGRLAEAAAAYREAIRIDPKYAVARINLGELLGRQGDHAAAIVEYQRALAAEPDHGDAQYNLGVSLQAMNRIDEAMTAYRAAIRLDPKFPDGHVNLANLLAQKGALDEAEREYKEALKLNPSHPAALQNLRGLQAQRQRKP